MFSSIRGRLALATAAAAIGLIGSALAASPALAQQYYIDYSSGQPAPIGTSYLLVSSNFSLTTSSGGRLASCASSTLSGATDAITPGGPSAGLSNTSGSFRQCTVAATGTAITIAGVFSPPWQFTPTSGTVSPFTGTVSPVSITVSCGGTPVTYTGNLTFTWTNGNPSTIALSGGPLTASRSACTLPTSVYVSATYGFGAFGGTPVTSGPDLIY